MVRLLWLVAAIAYPMGRAPSLLRTEPIMISPVPPVIGTTMVAASMITKILVSDQHALEAHDQK